MEHKVTNGELKALEHVRNILGELTDKDDPFIFVKSRSRSETFTNKIPMEDLITAYYTISNLLAYSWVFGNEKPTCPRGYTDCVNDPAYIFNNHPDWYKKLYGDMTPMQAAKLPNGCFEKVAKDPNEEYYCYDDEDK